MASAARTVDPPFAGAFLLTVSGVTIGAFTEVSGLAVQLDVEEIVEGGNNESTLKVPGRLKWANLVLKRGVTNNNSLFEWLAACSGEGFEKAGRKISRRTGSVTLLDSHRQPARVWSFREAMPVRWTGPTFAAKATDLAVEELEVSHGGFSV